MVNFAQSVGKPADMICLCIGGRLFVTRRATLYRLPDSRLYLIATQGTGGQTNSTPASNIQHAANAFNCQTDGQFVADSTRSFSTNRETTTIGGATIMPQNMAAMLTGNMNLISASSLFRARGSVVNSGAQLPSTCYIEQTNSNELEGSVSFPPSSPCTPMQPSGGGYSPFVPFVPHTPIVYFYDRDPEIFRFVLDYYRTGELHLPSSICGPFVRKELIFWGIDESLIGPCCMPAYMRYDEERRTKNTLFRDCFEDIDSMQNLVKFSRGWKKWRYRMWLFMDHPSSSLPAKIWASCLLVLMIASVMCYCLSTHKGFRMDSPVIRSALTDETRFVNKSSYVQGHIHIIEHELAQQRRTNHNILEQMTTATMNADKREEPLLEKFAQMCIEEKDNPKVQKDCTTEPARGLVLFDIALNVLFTTEFMLKVLLAPDKPKFLSSIVSVIDIIILSSYWVYMCAFYYYYYYPKSLVVSLDVTEDELTPKLWWMNILSMTQALRILRIFKISKISRGLRVLILTVKKSIPELVLLGFLLMNGMFLFSCLIYMAEYRQEDTFVDIPQSFWWSIITLTAVGYGDMYPKGVAGYFVGSVTAISGCIVTGLAIPIIGNNFNTYYKYMKNQLMEDKYLKNLRKDMEFTGRAGGKGGICAAAKKSGISLPGRKMTQFQRRVRRTKNIHIPSHRAVGLQIGFSRLVETISNSFRLLMDFSRNFGKNGQNQKEGTLQSGANISTQVLRGNQPLQENSVSNTLSYNIHFKESGRKFSNTKVVPIFEGLETDNRLSSIQPMTTNNLINLVTPSLACASHTWLDGEQTNGTGLYNEAIDGDTSPTRDRSNQSLNPNEPYKTMTILSVCPETAEEVHHKLNQKRNNCECKDGESLIEIDQKSTFWKNTVASKPPEYKKLFTTVMENQKIIENNNNSNILKRTNYV